MNTKLIRIALLAVFSSLILSVTASAEWKEKVLYTFTGGSDGGLPYTTLLSDGSGKWYGTTTWGGIPGCGGVGCGTVFMLSRNSKGKWSETVLYRFKGGNDGWNPQGNLVFDSKGNLFGATSVGGKNSACTYTLGCGTVFELERNGNNGWKKSTLYNFAGGADGQGPNAPLVWIGDNKLYGTTFFGGVVSCYGGVGCGTVFELKRNKKGGWSEHVLHRFAGSPDAAFAEGLTSDHGVLYGVTDEGGTSGCYGRGCGTVFEISRSSGEWVENVLYRFSGVADVVQERALF